MKKTTKNNKKLTMEDIRGRNADRAEIRGKEAVAVCCRCKHEFYASNMRYCPHPAVQKTYGRKAYICYYCCRKCKHGQKVGSGVKCVYPRLKEG